MKNKCATKFCRNKKAKHRSLCNKCRSANYRKNDIARYVYTNLRTNAKRRSKDFSLTFEEFKKFCDETDYLRLRGRNAGRMTIDRIKNDKGYSYDNIQMMELTLNVKKYLVENKIRDGVYPDSVPKIKACDNRKQPDDIF